MDKIRELIRRSYRSLRRRGLAGTLRHLALRPIRPRPPTHTRPAKDQAEDEEFDKNYGVDTAGITQLKTLAIHDSNWVFGNDYEPTPIRLFGNIMQAFAELKVPFEDYRFIDLGSGKGKALLLAAGYPFRSVIGVEIAHELSAAAEANIKLYTGTRKCRDIRSVCSDAGSFPFPDGNLMVYIYNSFDEEVMMPVLENIKEASIRQSREIYVILCYPRLEKLFQGDGFHEVLRHQNDYSIYRAVAS